MFTFHDLTTVQLRHVIHLKERIEYLQGLLGRLRGGSSAATKKKMGTRTESLGTARRAKVKSPVTKKKGGITTKSRTKVAAAMKARWAARKKGAA